MGHRALTALVTVGCVGVLGMGCPVCAEPIGATSWSGGAEAPDAEAPDAEASDAEGRQSMTTGALSQQEHHIRERQWRPSNTGQTEGGQGGRLLFQTDAQAVASAALTATDPIANEDAQWRRELADTVLDAVRPAYEGLASSGILDAVRSVDAELGLIKGPSFNVVLSTDYSQNTGHGAQPETVSWAGPANRPETLDQSRGGAHLVDDERNAAVMMAKLFEEVKPWAIALLALYVLGYMLKFSLDYVQWRATRRRKRRAMATGHTARKRHRRHRRRPTV